MINGQILRNFKLGNKEKIEKKISRFIKAGAEKLHLVMDFDRTLTTAGATTSWQFLNNHLPHTGQIKSNELFEHYYPLEKSNKLTSKDAVLWWKSNIRLLTQHRINLYEIEEDFIKEIKIRPYTRELFDLCNKAKITTVILSGGLKDVIDIWFDCHQIKPSLVLATKLIINSKGEIVDWEKKTLIHILNKREMGHAELTKIRKTKPNIILLGDSLQDAQMVEGKEDVLRILINNNLRPPEKVFKDFDLASENTSLFPIIDLLHLILNKDQCTQ